MMIRKMINPNPNLCGIDFSIDIQMPTCLNLNTALIVMIKNLTSDLLVGTVQSMKSLIRVSLCTVCTFPTR